MERIFNRKSKARESKKEEEEESDDRKLWDTISIPDENRIEFTGCSLQELASYVISGLKSLKSEKTKISLIFYREESKKSIYTTIRKRMDQDLQTFHIIRSNPNEIAINGMGVVHFYRTPITDNNREHLTNTTVYMISIDSLSGSETTQQLANDLQGGASIIMFSLTSGKIDSKDLPPAVSKATRTVEGIRKMLIWLLMAVVLAYLSLVAWKYVRKVLF